MPKKTLALIVGLVIVTIILFVIAIQNNTNLSQFKQKTGMKPSPTSPAQTVLMMSPASVSVVPGRQGSVDVMMDTYGNAVTAVQLELQYDPTLIGNLVVSTGTLFSNPVVLIDNNDPKTGRVTYAFGIQPNQQTISGKGTVATITFTGKGKIGDQTQLTFLPTSLVTARGVATSVLKNASGTVVTFTTAQALTSSTPSPSVANAAISPVVTTAPTGY